MKCPNCGKNVEILEPQKKWRSITTAGTKEELRFATETLGRFLEDWNWMPRGNKFTIGIRKEEHDRIDKKYKRIERKNRLQAPSF